MPFGNKTDQVLVGLITAILLAMGGLIFAEVSSHASEDALELETKERKAVDLELKKAQADLAREVTEYIKVQERRDGKVDKLLEQLETHMETDK